MCLSLQLPAEVLGGADEAALLPTKRACTAAGCAGCAAVNQREERQQLQGYSSYSNCGNAMQCGSILDQGSQLRAREGGQELSPLTKCGLVKASLAKASRTPYVALNETRARRWMAGELRLAYIANPAHTTSDRCERNLRSLAVWLRPLSCIMIVEVWMSRLRNKHGSLPHA